MPSSAALYNSIIYIVDEGRCRLSSTNVVPTTKPPERPYVEMPRSRLQSAEPGVNSNNSNTGPELPSRYLTSGIWRFNTNPGFRLPAVTIKFYMPSVKRARRRLDLTTADYLQCHPILPIGDRQIAVEWVAYPSAEGKHTRQLQNGALIAGVAGNVCTLEESCCCRLWSSRMSTWP